MKTQDEAAAVEMCRAAAAQSRQTTYLTGLHPQPQIHPADGLVTPVRRGDITILYVAWPPHWQYRPKRNGQRGTDEIKTQSNPG